MLYAMVLGLATLSQGVSLEVAALTARADHSVNWSESPVGPSGTVLGVSVTASKPFHDAMASLLLATSADLGWSLANRGGLDGSFSAVVGFAGEHLRFGVGVAQLVYAHRNYREWTPFGASVTTNVGTRYYYPRALHGTLAVGFGDFVGSLVLDQGLRGGEYTTRRLALTLGVRLF